MKLLLAGSCAALLLGSLNLHAGDASPVPLREAVDGLSEADLQEFLQVLRTNYVKPDVLTETELSRATVQGLLERLAPGASLLAPAASGEPEASPFKTEFVESRIAYLRMGSFLPAHLDLLDKALADFATKKLAAMILDLRATPAGSEFEQAAEVCQRFCPKGRVLFTVHKPNAEDLILTSKRDPKYTGLLVALVDSDTAGAAEIVAGVLRTQARAMVIGQRTRGAAAEFAEIPLPSGKLVRVAVAEAALPESTPIFPGGVKPDLAVAVSQETTAAVLKQGLEKGVSGLIADTERTKMNEAALVAGRNPELDALQVAQANKGERPPAVLRDLVLQRALDFVTSVVLYEKKSAPAGK